MGLMVLATLPAFGVKCLVRGRHEPLMLIGEDEKDFLKPALPEARKNSPQGRLAFNYQYNVRVERVVRFTFQDIWDQVRAANLFADQR